MSERHYNTPEGFLAVPADAEPGYYIDAINAALLRARSVLLMVSGQFDGTNSGDRYTDGVIAGALWSVEGNLALIEKLVQHGWETVREGTGNG